MRDWLDPLRDVLIEVDTRASFWMNTAETPEEEATAAELRRLAGSLRRAVIALQMQGRDGRDAPRKPMAGRTPAGKYRCPRCDAAFFGGMVSASYCSNCGQMLDWRGINA